MTTSGSTDYTLTTNDLIDEAYNLCGIGQEGESITADMYARATRSLNLMVKTWQAQGHLWLKTERTLTLTASTASYNMSPRPLRILSIRRRTTGSIDSPLMELSREEYFELPNKTVAGTPLNWFYDPQRSTGTLYLWPTASTAVAASDSLKITYLRAIEDFDTSTDNPDVPQEWLETLAYNLAVKLALKYGVNPTKRAEIALEAARLFASLHGWDNETASLFIQPGGR